MFDSSQLKYHQETARKLDQIMQAAFLFISQNRENIDEFIVKEFVKIRLKANNLISDKDNPIVAFGPNTSHVHYYANKESARKLDDGDLILIDLWAKNNQASALYADITWMGYAGYKIFPKFLDKFDKLLDARDLAIRKIRESLQKNTLPIAGEIDRVIRDLFEQHNLRQHFLHTTGHPIGTTSAHGRCGGGIWLRNKKVLHKNIPYTIEPGLYFKDDFGLRSEIDFYINEDLELVITTTPQANFVLI